MIPMLLAAVLLAQNDGRVITKAPQKAVPAEAVDAVRAEPEPDVITRGGAATIVVKGRDVESLKTLKVDPPDGVRLGEIKTAPARADGAKAVSVVVTVDANAKPGDRDLTLTVAPTIMGSGARPGDDEAAKQMEKMMQEIVKRETKPEPAGSIHINSHDLKITKAEVVRGESGLVVRVTVEDKEGDITAGMPEGAAEKEGTIVQIIEPLVSEVRCGHDVFYDAVMESSIRERKPPSVMLQADLDTTALAGKSGCELRVRAQDKAENLSAWFTTKLEPR